MASWFRNMWLMPGVKSLADLGANKDKFEGKIYGIEAGNDGNRIIGTMIDDAKNNLAGFELVESSEAGMLTQAEKAMKNNEWIIFLGWTPHPVMGDMKIAYLDGMGDSGFGAATVLYQRARGLYRGMPECREAAEQSQVQPRHGRRHDGTGAQGWRRPEGNGADLAQGQSGYGEALA